MTTLLALSLAEVGMPPPPEERTNPRLRAGVAFAFGGIGASTVGGGPGVSAELGVTLHDRISLVARLNAGTIWVLTGLQGSLAAGLALGEHVELSLGAGIGFPFGIGEGIYGSLSALVPVRVMFSPQPRNLFQTRRNGLFVFLEAAPGAEFVRFIEGRRDGPENRIVLGAWVGVGAAWW